MAVSLAATHAQLKMGMKMLVKDYTPTTINEIVFGKEESRVRLVEILSGSKPFPFGGKNGILIHGVWGSGKTTLARMLPNAIESTKTNGASTDAYPMFVACTRGVNGVNALNAIANSAAFTSINDSGCHYFVLDEVDLLTNLAQESLKTTMNTSNTVFVMTTNHLNEIDKGVVNRSILIEMNAANPSLWLPFARKVMADNDVVGVSDTTVENLIRPCNGSARDIVDTLFRVISRRLEK